MVAKFRGAGIIPLKRAYTVQHVAQTSAKRKIKEVDSTNPFLSPLVDSFNRKHDYLRISLTERCNLRCFYCMPSEGIELSPDGNILTNAEILRLASLFVRNGVTKIRLTGGEPSIRKGIVDIIRGLNELRPLGLTSIAMTSNGLALHRRLPELVENGLTHLNLSLDTLDPFKFELITRRRGHEAVLKALDAALATSLVTVKLNVVVMKGLNDAEILDFVAITEGKPISVRFIEFMPFTGNKWEQNKMVPSSELLNIISARYPSAARALEEPNETARIWKIPGFRGSFGFISSMSDHFCSSCNRLRLTADGQIKVCLFDPNEVSLRDRLRQGAKDEELLSVIRRALSAKKEKHAGMNDIDVQTNRPMILIGKRPVQNNTGRHQLTRVFPLQPQPFTLHTLRLYSTSPHLSHVDEHGRAKMVDVSEKRSTKRTATASGYIYITHLAYELVTSNYPPHKSGVEENDAAAKSRRKGDTLTVAQLAAIMGAKQTASLIPLCHPLALSKVDVSLKPELLKRVDGQTRHAVRCSATVSCEGKTGVEMEALTAVSVGLLTVWDMLKAVAGREMEISGIRVTQKAGGASGDFCRSKDN